MLPLRKHKVKLGSPPRGRGKAFFAFWDFALSWITPAWAGKRLSILGLSKGGEDHPRVGGEKMLAQKKTGLKRGSPPRGRGKGAAFFQLRNSEWITPAWAGKSSIRIVWVCAQWDHPRVGGEKITRQEAETKAKGSPPRGRGKVLVLLCNLLLLRITPAWAGKSYYEALARGGSRDHPRVGGEKLTGRFLAVTFLGSPPRGRGKVCVPARCTVSAGITPAWAGKS